MPCVPVIMRIDDGKRRCVGILCRGNEPIEIKHAGRTHLFEWHAYCGWMPTNRDGSERLSRVPDAVWKLLEQVPRPDGGGET